MTTMTRLDREAAIRLAQQTRKPIETRVPTGPHDYGDELTVGLQMKRNSYRLGAGSGDDDFGVYLGKHDQGYAILIWDVFYRPTAAEVFQTLNDMKAEWRLD